MEDITKRYGIITGGTGSFGSMQHTDGDAEGSARVEILDQSKNLKNIASVSASGDIQGAAGTFGGNVSVAGNLTVNGTTTSVNSTAIDLGDRIINLNSSNASGDAGFYVNDTDTNQTGSLLWDSDQDAWMGGVKDAEVHLVDLSSAQTMTNKTMTSPVISSGDINSPDIDGGTIDGATIATSNVTVGAGKTLDVSAGTLTLANNQISGDKVEGGTIASITISQLGGAMDANSQAMTNVNIDSGNIDGATIATSDVTVGASKTLDVSAGTLTTSAAQKLAIMEGANANVDIGTFDLRASTLTADSMTSGRVAIYGANGVLADDSDLSFSGDTLTATKIGAFEAAGAIDFSDEAMTNVNVDSGAIDGTVIGANSAAAGTFAAVVATTMAGTSLSASSFVSASSLTIGEDSATIDYSTSLDLSLGSTKYAALSTAHFSASVELQGPSLEVSGAAQVGSLTINGTALTATAAEINDLASNAVDGSDFTKLSEVTATSTELNYVDVTAGTATASKAVVLDGSKNIATLGTVGCGAITSTGASSFGATTLSSLNNSSGGITNAGSIAGATSVDGSGDLTMGTITMTGFSVDADGDTSVKTLASTGGVTGTTGTFSGILKSDDTTEATSTTDGSLQTDGGLSVAKSAVVGDDLDLLSDAAILNFGADKDVNLTHVADTGLLLNSAMKLQFRDSTEFVHSDADGYMHMEGATGVNLAINGSDVLAVSSTKVSSKQDHEFLGSMKFGMGSDHYINNKTGDNNLLLESMSAGVTAGSWFKVTGDLTVTGNDIKDASNSPAITFDGSTNTTINGTLGASGHITLASGKDLLAADATCEIGSSGTKFAAVYATNVYTGDMHLKNERGDWTIFEESDHLRIRNNATGQTFKMGMTPIEEE